jgi:hypothetical protein
MGSFHKFQREKGENTNLHVEEQFVIQFILILIQYIVNVEMNIQVPLEAGKLLNGGQTCGLSQSAQLHIFTKLFSFLCAELYVASHNNRKSNTYYVVWAPDSEFICLLRLFLTLQNRFCTGV